MVDPRSRQTRRISEPCIRHITEMMVYHLSRKSPPCGNRKELCRAFEVKVRVVSLCAKILEFQGYALRSRKGDCQVITLTRKGVLAGIGLRRDIDRCFADFCGRFRSMLRDCGFTCGCCLLPNVIIPFGARLPNSMKPWLPLFIDRLVEEGKLTRQDSGTFGPSCRLEVDPEDFPAGLS